MKLLGQPKSSARQKPTPPFPKGKGGEIVWSSAIPGRIIVDNSARFFHVINIRPHPLGWGLVAAKQ